MQAQDPNGLQYQPRPEGGGSGSNRKAVGANAGETAKGKVDWVSGTRR